MGKIRSCPISGTPATLFEISVGKKEPHILVPAGFMGAGWGKLSGEKSLGLMAIDGNPVGGFPAVFLKSGQDSGVFSTRTENGGFAGFSGIVRDTRRRN
jgi:hypothetical protein